MVPQLLPSRTARLETQQSTPIQSAGMPPKTKSSFKESRLPSDSSIEPKVLAMMVGIEQLPLWSCPPCPSLSEGRTESTMSVVGSSTSETNLPEDVVLIDGNAMKMTSRSEKPGYIEIAR